MRRLLIIIGALVIAATSFSQPLKLTTKDLKQLARMMSGEFSSEQQSKADPAFIHIKLSMTPVMKDNTDGYWLYVEQAVASSADKPYRQRVYHLYLENDSTITSKVYELRNPQQYTGGRQYPEKLAVIAPDSLIDRQGCSIYLHKTDKKLFAGKTPGKECQSSLGGATYATSEVTVTPRELVSWDRGWNREDIQVWGAEKGGYVFLKK